MNTQNEEATIAEMTTEELEQVAGGNIFSSISAAAAQRAALKSAVSNMVQAQTELRARTPDAAFGPMNHYIID